MPPTDRRALLVTALLITGLAGARLILAANVGLGDVEAYYWTWSRAPAWGYLDHGPLVAWILRSSTALFGDGTFGVRALFVLLSAATMALLASLAARLSPAGWRAAPPALLALLTLPMFLIAGAAANPDGPFLWAAMLFFWALLSVSPLTSKRLVLAGFAAGLATSAKLFGLALLLPLVWALLRSTPRPRLSRRFAALLAFLVGAAPVLLWNATHGWASLRYHLASRHQEHAVGPSLLNLGKLVGGQLGYVGPLTLVGLLLALHLLWRRRADVRMQLLLLAVLALLLPAYLLILVVPGAEPHWPAAGYLPLLIVLAEHLREQWDRRWLRWTSYTALGLAALLFVVFHVHVLTGFFVRRMPASYVPRYDLANELHGWPRIGDTVARWMLRARKSRPLLVAGCHYTVCSQLRFAAHGRFEVLCPSPRLDQFDFFPGGDGSQRRGIDLLYLRDERFPFSVERLYRCASAQTLQTLPISRGGRIVRRFTLVLCRDFRGLRALGWPPAKSAPKASESR